MAKNKNKKMARKKSGAQSGASESSSSSASDTVDTAPKKKRTSPFTYIAQVRSEVEIVTWPSRNEWFVTTVMVFIMVVLASTFFFLIDIVIKQGVQFLMGFGG